MLKGLSACRKIIMKEKISRTCRDFTTVAKKDFMVTHKCKQNKENALYDASGNNCTSFIVYGNSLPIKMFA